MFLNITKTVTTFKGVLGFIETSAKCVLGEAINFKFKKNSFKFTLLKKIKTIQIPSKAYNIS